MARPFKLPNGLWKGVFVVSSNPRKTRTKTHKKHSVVANWLAQQQIERDAARDPEPAQSDMLFSDWAATWLADTKRRVAESTYADYEDHLERFAVPALGSLPLAELRPMAFRNLIADLERNYASRRTLLKVYEVSLRCLNAAVKMELIPRNPVAQVQRPKYSRKDIRPFSVAEVKAILKAAEGHRLEALFVVAFSLGLRQGEMYAIEWGDLDWDRRTLRIDRHAVNTGGRITVKTPKTKAGRRTVDLADNVIAALRDRQAIAMTEGQAANPLIFPAPRGGYIQRNTFAVRHWKPLLKTCGIDARGMHHTRHTFATHALMQGCPLHVVSKILGHSSPTVTLEAYSHLIDTGQRETVDKVSALFSSQTKVS